MSHSQSVQYRDNTTLERRSAFRPQQQLRRSRPFDAIDDTIAPITSLRGVNDDATTAQQQQQLDHAAFTPQHSKSHPPAVLRPIFERSCWERASPPAPRAAAAAVNRRYVFALAGGKPTLDNPDTSYARHKSNDCSPSPTHCRLTLRLYRSVPHVPAALPRNANSVSSRHFVPRSRSSSADRTPEGSEAFGVRFRVAVVRMSGQRNCSLSSGGRSDGQRNISIRFRSPAVVTPSTGRRRRLYIPVERLRALCSRVSPTTNHAPPATSPVDLCVVQKTDSDRVSNTN